MRAAWTAFLVLVACGTWAESQLPTSIPSNFSHEPHRQTESEEAKSGELSRADDKQPTVVVTASPSINLEARDQKRQIDKNSSVEWWSIAVSLALLVVASLQLLTYRRQAKLMAEQANIMKGSLDLQRPIVYGKISKPGLSVSPHGGLFRGILELSIDNIGATPANLTRIEWGVFVAPHGEIAPAIDPVMVGGRELPIGTVAIKGEPFFETEKMALRFMDAQTEILEFKSTVWVIGFVRYVDVFERHRISGFAHALDLIHARFVRRGGDGYNYAREEVASKIPPKSS